MYGVMGPDSANFQERAKSCWLDVDSDRLSNAGLSWHCHQKGD